MRYLRLLRERHAAGEELPERDRLRPLVHRLPAGGGGDHEPGGLLGEEDRGDVGVEHGAHPHHEVVEDVPERPMHECGVHEQLHAADHLGRALGLGARDLLAQELLALLLGSPPIGDVAQEGGHHDLGADAHARDRPLGGEDAAVATLKVGLDAHDLHGLGRLEQDPAPLVVGLALVLGEDQRAQRLADRLRGRPAEEALRGGVPRVHQPIAVDRHEGVRRAVEHEARARLAALNRPSALLRGEPLRPQAREQPRDQQAGDQRRAHGQQPAHDGAVRLDQDQHDRVAHRDQRHVGERDGQPEEVEGVQRRPRVEDRVEDRRLDEVVREGQDHRAAREEGVQLPRRDAVGGHVHHEAAARSRPRRGSRARDPG